MMTGAAARRRSSSVRGWSAGAKGFLFGGPTEPASASLGDVAAAYVFQHQILYNMHAMKK